MKGSIVDLLLPQVAKMRQSERQRAHYPQKDTMRKHRRATAAHVEGIALPTWISLREAVAGPHPAHPSMTRQGSATNAWIADGIACDAVKPSQAVSPFLPRSFLSSATRPPSFPLCLRRVLRSVGKNGDARIPLSVALGGGGPVASLPDRGVAFRPSCLFSSSTFSSSPLHLLFRSPSFLPSSTSRSIATPFFLSDHTNATHTPSACQAKESTTPTATPDAGQQQSGVGHFCPRLTR